MPAIDPRFIDADDAYLRCQDCGWAFPLIHTATDEKCCQCNGHLDCVRDSGECPRCGQRGGETVCPPCRKLEREPQGETVRLFEPAPTQLEGQLTL